MRGSEVSPVEVSPVEAADPAVVENQGPVEESERVESRRNEGEEEGKEEGMKMEGRMEEPEDAPGEEQRKVNVSFGAVAAHCEGNRGT